MLTRVALPPGVPIAGEPDVNVVGGRNIFAWSSRTICHLQGAVTWQNQCHDRATLQCVRIPSAILKIVLGHILFYFVFSAVLALTSGGFRIVSDALVLASWQAANLVENVVADLRERVASGSNAGRKPAANLLQTCFTQNQTW